MTLIHAIGVDNHHSHSASPPLVSIITPAFNAAATLGKTIRSVLSQTYAHWEMLIVSDDGVDYENLIRRNGIIDNRLRFYTTGSYGSGPNITRNIAMEHALGELIAPLDADDIYYPERLEALVPAAMEFGMVGDNALIIDSRSNQAMGTIFPSSYGMRWLSLSDFLSIQTPMIFVFREDVIDRGWDADIHLGADTLFNLRGVERVKRVPIFTRILHEYIVRQGSICHARDSHLRAEQAYTYTLKRLEDDGLGFQSWSAKEVVRSLVTKKRTLNRRFMQSLEKGLCQNFADFITRRQQATYMKFSLIEDKAG